MSDNSLFNCTFNNCSFNNINIGYTCKVLGRDIPKVVDENFFKGVHSFSKTNSDVKSLALEKINFASSKLPRGLGEVFPNLTRLIILNSNFKVIFAEDLKQFPNLEVLICENNQVEGLPGELFKFNPKIKEINFSGNKIRDIPPSVLKNVLSLEVIDFRKNIWYDCFYDKENSSMTLGNFKNYIEAIWKTKISSSTQNSSRVVQKSSNVIEKQPKVTQNCNVALHKSVEQFLTLDEFKDFTIKVNEKVFNVHKFIFMARSLTFAQMIRETPDATEMVLTDIPLEIFEEILSYIYTDSVKIKNYEDAKKILMAAEKLKIETLKEVVVKFLTDLIKNESDLDKLMEIFNLAFKFRLKNLKLKAFEEIKKHFGGVKIKDELQNQPEKLEKLIEAKKKSDEARRILEEQLKEFEESERDRDFVYKHNF